MAKLKSVHVKGFRSFRDVNVPLHPEVTMVVGENGVGKSNLHDLFDMVSHMASGRFQHFAEEAGSRFLFLNGPTTPATMHVSYEIDDGNGLYYYDFALTYAPAADRAVFTEELFRLGSTKPNVSLVSVVDDYGEPATGHRESRLKSLHDRFQPSRALVYWLERAHAFHFPNTSTHSGLRAPSLDRTQYLRSEASNLASYLYSVKSTDLTAFQRIVSATRAAAPMVAGIDVRPASQDQYEIVFETVGSDTVFPVSRMSDGTLRFIVLATLLLQPDEKRPRFISLDEPELGLHPGAVRYLADIIKHVTRPGQPQPSQIVLFTQSPTLLDCFEKENILVARRSGNETTFATHDDLALEEWLKDFTLGELQQDGVLR